MSSNFFGMNQQPTTTLFKSITMLCETNSIPPDIPHIQSECEEYLVEYHQSHI